MSNFEQSWDLKFMFSDVMLYDITIPDQDINESDRGAFRKENNILSGLWIHGRIWGKSKFVNVFLYSLVISVLAF